MAMPGRTFISPTAGGGTGLGAGSIYRYGFNGKEKDNSTGEGDLDFGARIYNGRLGRWLSIDPLQRKYTNQSPYNFVVNNPILLIDYNGKDTIRFKSVTTNVFIPLQRGLSDMVYGGKYNSSTKNFVTVLQSPGDDVFLYDEIEVYQNAHGSFSIPKTTPFFPNKGFSRSGITKSRCTDGCYYPTQEVNDVDYITLAKLSSTELVNYLTEHDKEKYGSLTLTKYSSDLFEKVYEVADILMIAEGGYSLFKLLKGQGTSIWALNQFERGKAFNILKGENLVTNFPVIDKWTNGTATSLKTIDLTADTYQDMKKLKSTIEGYIDKLADFKGARKGGVEMNSADIKSRVLEIGIQPGKTSSMQKPVLQSLIEYANKANVKLIWTKVK